MQTYLLDYNLNPIICKICGNPIKQSEGFGCDSFHDKTSFYCEFDAIFVDFERKLRREECKN